MAEVQLNKSYPLLEVTVPNALDKVYQATQEDGKPNRVTNLSKLNVFIGPNNSGKSRFLRELFSDDELLFALATNNYELIENALTILPFAINELPENSDIRPRFQDLLDKLFHMHQNWRGVISKKIPNEIFDILVETQSDPFRYQHTYKTLHQHKINGALINLRDISQTAPIGYTQYEPKYEKFEFKKIYIPAIRGLRHPEQENDFYFQQTQKNYFPEVEWLKKEDREAENTSIFTGKEHFGTLMKWLLGDLHQRKLVRQYEEYLSKNFFNGDEVTLIPRTHDQTVHIKIGIEKEQPIHNLGDGLQQILILTLPIFLHHDKNLLLFIEEPELYLHPGFQRLLIDTFLKDDGYVRQIFVATHSHQFLDITIDEKQCSVYKFKKELPDLEEGSKEEVTANFKITNTTNSDFSLLADLGVRNSSVLLSNCTIWVEGITDRLYLRKYLEVYHSFLDDGCPEFFEDIHYSFVEYGGNNITHWSFLDADEGMDVSRICGNLFLISDSDSDKKKKRQTELAKILDDRYFCLECREIENLLTPDVIKNVVINYENNSELELKNFTQSKYLKSYLGNFIEKNVLPNDYESNRPIKSEDGRPYAAKSGTIKDKTAFCNKAIQAIDELSPQGIDTVLCPEVQKLCEQIYDFIQHNNK